MVNGKKVDTVVEEKDIQIDSIMNNVNVVGLAGLGGAEEMRKKMAENMAIKDVIIDFVNKNFVRGIDYGEADPRSKKETLLKPGAEKICHLFNTHPVWFNDFDTWEILGKPNGTVCMICRIVDNDSGAIIGEGRGAETVGTKNRDANKTIKIAEKCALVDAALYTFMLSERFTQDKVEVQNVITGRRNLYNHVTQLRAGCESSLTDNNFLIKVCEREIHKKTISTKTELDLVWKSIENYDYATGERIPEGV